MSEKIKNNPHDVDKVEVTFKEYKDGKVIEEYTTEQFMLVAEIEKGDKQSIAVVSHLNMPLGRTMEIAMMAAALAKTVITSTMQSMSSLTNEPKEEEDGSREG